jgi:predicted nucleotidyltransferase component of viral defense system
MDIRETPYFEQADLLLQILPAISKIESFALKGGTAINLFLRNLPRLSVDIDLTYLPLDDRSTTLENIDSYLTHIAKKCQDMFRDCRISTKKQNGLSFSLTIARSNAAVKIEPNTTIRGTVFPATILRLCPKAQNIFGRSVEIQTLSLEDLYGGKLCAALDRQHPRDLFDVDYLYLNEGITDKIRHAFIVFLFCPSRPIAELLAPKLKDDLEVTFKETFEGMAFEPVPLGKMVEVWKEVVKKLNHDFTENERAFMLSFKRKSPQWDLFPVKGIQHLPAVKWKMVNLKKMDAQKHKITLRKLEDLLAN